MVETLLYNSRRKVVSCIVVNFYSSKDSSKEAMSFLTTYNEEEGRAKASEQENVISMTEGLKAACLVAP